MTSLKASAAGRFRLVASPTAAGFVQAAAADPDGLCHAGVAHHG
jgi:hypothetical protein